MLKYTQNKNINYHDLTRFDKIETRKAEAQFIYINYFDLHVFLFFLILIYLINSTFTLLQLGRPLTLYIESNFIL